MMRKRLRDNGLSLTMSLLLDSRVVEFEDVVY